MRPTNTKATEAPEGLLYVVERLLREAVGQPVTVCSLHRRPSPYATLCPVEILTLTLEGDAAVTLFVKHLGSQEADHPDKQCRDREVRIYEELLGVENLPVARYYGIHREEATKRSLLFLEYLDGWNLKYHDLDQWVVAARSLARLHKHFAKEAERLLGCTYLLRFDAPYLGDWARRAHAAVADQSAALAARLEPITSHYDRVAAVLGGPAPTLVHNDLAPKNVVVSQPGAPPRVCFVDWEMAGVGCGLLDLVHLKYGLDPVQDRRMYTAYCHELADTELLPSDPRDREVLLAACELHKTIYRIAHSRSWRLPASRVASWIGEAWEAWARL